MKRQNHSAFEISRLLVAVVMATFIACLFFGMALDLWWYESDSPEHILSASQLEGYGLEALLFYFISRFAEYPFLQLLFAAYETILVMLTWMIGQKFIDKFFEINKWMNLAISTGLIFLTSIYIPRYSPWFYRFSLGTQPWHNSTQLGMRLGAVVFLYYFLEVYPDYQEKISIRSWLKMVIPLIITTMFKPNFLLSLCPTLGLVLLIDLVTTKSRSKKAKSIFAIGSVIIPSLFVLGVQYILIYNIGNNSSSSGIQVVFVSDLLWEGSAQHMIVKLGRDLGFPCLTMGILLCFRVSCRDSEFLEKHFKNACFLFLLFLMSLVIYSVFKESGARAAHGNFGWGKRVAYYTLFIYLVPLFIQSMKRYKMMLTQLHTVALNVGFAMGSILLILHLVSGVYYFVTTAAGLSYYR